MLPTPRCAYFSVLCGPLFSNAFMPCCVVRVYLGKCSTSQVWYSHVQLRSLFCVRLMLGGVAKSNCCNPSSARIHIIYQWCRLLLDCSHALPSHIAASLALRCFVFFFGQCMLRTSWCTYLAGSVKHIRNGFPSKT